MTKRTSSILGLALAGLAAASVAAARADQQADALLKRVAAKQAAVKSLSAEFTMTQRVGGQEQTYGGTVKLVRPDRVLLSYTPPIDQTIFSDGKEMLIYTKTSNQYRKLPQQPGQPSMAAPPFTPMGIFMANTLPPAGATAKLLPKQMVDGVAYRVVELSYATPAARSERLFIGPDDLVQRTEVEFKQGAQSINLRYALKNVKPGGLVAADVTFTLPQTAKVYEQPDFNAKLIKVGEDAPKFRLPQPRGGQIALENTLKDKKAVLVNFWFYN